jgi:hypothetical protein
VIAGPQAFNKVRQGGGSLKLRPIQFFLFLKERVGTEEMLKMMVAIKVAKQV